MGGQSRSERDLLRRFGRRVRALREARGLSQEALAHHVGLHRTYVGAIERGERNVSLINIARLADGLSVPVAHLFDGNSDEA